MASEMCVVVNDEEKMSFEDALTKAGFGLYSLLMAALAGVAIISFACIFYSSTIVVPISACELATSGAQQGMLVAGPIVGAISGAVVWGYIADWRGRRNTLMTSLLLGAGVNVLASLSTNWIMLLTLQFIASLMISGQFSLSMTILSESVPLARRNLVILLVTSIFLLAQGLMAVLAMPIIPMSFSYHLPYLDIQWTSWRLLLVVYSLPSLLTALWLSYMQESPKFVYSKGDEDKALEILKVIHRVNHRRCADEFQVKGLLMRRLSSEGAMTSNNHFALLFTPPLLKHTLIMTLLFLLEQLAAFKVWLPTIAHRFVQVVGSGQGRNLTLCSIIATSLDDQHSEDTAPSAATCALDFEALLIVLVVTVMLSMTNALMTLGVERIGRRYMVMVVTCVAGASGVLVNLVPSAAASAALFVLQLMGIVALGLYTALCVALFPTRLRALAMTLTMTGTRVASFMSIQVINYLLIHNCELAFYVYGFLLAFSAVVAYFLPGDAPRRFSHHEILQEEPDDG